MQEGVKSEPNLVLRPQETVLIVPYFVGGKLAST